MLYWYVLLFLSVSFRAALCLFVGAFFRWFSLSQAAFAVCGLPLSFFLCGGVKIGIFSQLARVFLFLYSFGIAACVGGGKSEVITQPTSNQATE